MTIAYTYGIVDFLHFGHMRVMRKAKEVSDKVIFVGNPTPEQLRQNLPVGVDIETHRAHGGHIKIEAPDEAVWSGGRYITPLCPACNEKRGQYILLQKDTLLCQEVGATVVQ